MGLGGGGGGRGGGSPGVPPHQKPVVLRWGCSGVPPSGGWECEGVEALGRGGRLKGWFAAQLWGSDRLSLHAGGNRESSRSLGRCRSSAWQDEAEVRLVKLSFEVIGRFCRGQK